ncbi:hypothetical protein Taro_027602 [Colocasia esculenta]|uniref:Uncharacterized protein n=1 Tax=Colocasia esculenta TaxID=4460 RepID=A0A843V951_COLES|nr:hypothetical protein [Colocasia esculenta]
MKSGLPVFPSQPLTISSPPTPTPPVDPPATDPTPPPAIVQPPPSTSQPIPSTSIDPPPSSSQIEIESLINTSIPSFPLKYRFKTHTVDTPSLHTLPPHFFSTPPSSSFSSTICSTPSIGQIVPSMVLPSGAVPHGHSSLLPPFWYAFIYHSEHHMNLFREFLSIKVVLEVHGMPDYKFKDLLPLLLKTSEVLLADVNLITQKSHSSSPSEFLNLYPAEGFIGREEGEDPKFLWTSSASSILMSDDNDNVVMGKKLGGEYYEVSILIAHDPTTSLFIKDVDRKNMNDAVGSHIIWFKEYVPSRRNCSGPLAMELWRQRRGCGDERMGMAAHLLCAAVARSG